ncbi:hypothetical protein AJ78_05830 [Emergomyces pasteurianus Ep9510]|uniref:RRM domain-containing protein n=1 Tax=Emergomyces pasteurianus Ep9510 TaxID=1447872 RepID=A0A1J9PCM9_9EURO|nr:hypothetical protein AJ78_05830 [Emergomyces pasteurianus Ep9510]
MPGLKEASPAGSPTVTRKRKLDEDPALEIDLSAPEPPSKKALRKAKKKSVAPQTTEPSAPSSANSTSAAPTKPQALEPAERISKRSDYGVWIGNLPFTVKKDDVRAFFTSPGVLKSEEITRIHLPEGAKQNGKPQNKGFAYVDFTTQRAMETAIAMSEQLISGRRALIKNAHSFAGRPDKSKQGEVADSKDSNAPAHAPSQRVFVGNLGFDVTKEILEEHFKPCGVIEDIQVATFQDTGKCKGYAWVEFDGIDAAEAAMRGFANVPEEEEEEEEEEEKDMNGSDAAEESSNEESKSSQVKAKSNKKPRMKRVWVNRIMGRPLRMEFAEDKATRYKKRFGKDGTSKDKFSTESEGGNERTGSKSTEAPAIEEVSEKPTSSFQRPRAGKSPGGFKKGAPSSGGRYAQDVVQRLSGAIVESQGKKTKF